MWYHFEIKSLDFTASKLGMRNVFIGRLDRKHYLFFLILYFLVTALISGYVLGGGLAFFFILWIVVIPVGPTVRRLHDINLSGWYYFLSIGLLQIATILITIMAVYNIYGTLFGGQISPMSIWSNEVFLMSILIVASVSALFTLYIICKKGNPVSNKFGEVPDTQKPFIRALLNRE